MQEALDEARAALLERLKRDAMRVPADQIRNLATAYGILSDKKLEENRLSGPLCDASGDMFFVDALGRRVAIADVPKP